ncbi:MAG: hypothetical protein Q7J73_03330 [Dehalococcoidales bacterium]|nr:hypothetical protein [Dehalococcoidales bacterium]
MSEEVKKSEVKKKRGAPKGNQNARKHGFYSKVLDLAQQEALPAAAKLTGLGEEIALLRTKTRSVVANDPRNYKLINMAASSIARLLRTSRQLGKLPKKARNNSRTKIPGSRTIVS